MGDGCVSDPNVSEEWVGGEGSIWVCGPNVGEGSKCG